MSYVIKNGNDADATWLNKPGYTILSGSAADGQFGLSEDTDIVASGNLIQIIQNVSITAPAHNAHTIAQTIGIIASGNLIEIEQAVDLRITGQGPLLSIGQTINTVAAGNLTRVAQSVRATIAPTEYEPPFDLELIVGDMTIPCSQIHGAISISRSESSAALMDVTLIPPKGAQNITQYQGKSIILNYIEGNASTRIYTGKVDIPEIDIMGQKITLRCTDNRTEQNNALNPVFVQGIGQYSEAVFGEAKDQNDEIEKRLRTVQASLDYDANGLVTYTSWTPKATADFVFDNPDIYRRTPQVEVLSRGRVINQVTLDITYRWTRLRHRERSWKWTFPWNANEWCGFLVDDIGVPPSDAPRRAAQGAGWAIKPGSYQTIGLPPTRAYHCRVPLTVQGFPVLSTGWQTIVWSPTTSNCDTRQKTDSSGNVVTDSSGNPVYESVTCLTSNQQNDYAISAQWTAAKRWAQTVEQHGSYTISAPQSIAQYGLVERSDRTGVQSDFDAQSWETMDSYQHPPANSFHSANGDYVLNQNLQDIGEMRDAFSCIAAKAAADILGSHRQNYVTLQLPFQPGIDLRHTIETTAGKIKCKGKAYSIRHMLDVRDKFSETEIQIALSRSEGSAVDNRPPLNFAPVSDPLQAEPNTFRMGTWVGGRGGVQLTGYDGDRQTDIDLSDKSAAGLPKGAQGFITNYRVWRPQPLFTESFIVDTPDIEASARDLLITESTQSGTVAIRNDHLEIVFDE